MNNADFQYQKLNIGPAQNHYITPQRSPTYEQANSRFSMHADAQHVNANPSKFPYSGAQAIPDQPVAAQVSNVAQQRFQNGGANQFAAHNQPLNYTNAPPLQEPAVKYSTLPNTNSYGRADFSPRLPNNYIKTPQQAASPASQRTHQYAPTPKPVSLDDQSSKIQNLKAQLKEVPFYKPGLKKQLQAQLTQARAPFTFQLKEDIKVLNLSIPSAKNMAQASGKNTPAEVLHQLSKDLDSLEEKIPSLATEQRPHVQKMIAKTRAAIGEEVSKNLAALSHDLRSASNVTDFALWDKSVNAVESWNKTFTESYNTNFSKLPQVKNAFAQLYRQMDASAKDHVEVIRKELHTKNDPKLSREQNLTNRLLELEKQLDILPGTKTILALRKSVSTEKVVKEAKAPKKDDDNDVRRFYH